MNSVHIGQLLSFELHRQQKENSLMRPQVCNDLPVLHNIQSPAWASFIFLSEQFRPYCMLYTLRYTNTRKLFYVYLIQYPVKVSYSRYKNGIWYNAVTETQKLGLLNVKVCKRNFSNCPKRLGNVQNKSR